MIETRSLSPAYQTRFDNGRFGAVADTTQDKGGGDSGFRPHDLLEAALASCINISVRMAAQEQEIPLETVSTTVEVDRSLSDETVFRYRVELGGPLGEDDRRRLLAAAESSSVRRTLSKKLSFQAE